MLSALAFLFTYLLASAFALPASSLSLRDVAVTCSTAKPTDILSFFITNYLTFAFTVRSAPGVKTSQIIRTTINAFLFPFGGIVQGCNAIAQAKRWGESNLDHMARAGVLCTVVRGPSWQPRPGQVIRGCRLTAKDQNCGIVSLEEGPGDEVALFHPSVINRSRYNVLGQISDNMEAEGYLLRFLQPGSRVKPLIEGQELYVPTSSGFVKGFVAIAQLIFACITLYNTSDQAVAQYGYAAYGFTVVPYAVMSFVNLAAQVTCPEYPALFLVRCEIMEEAEQAGVTFGGFIGVIDPKNVNGPVEVREGNDFHDILVEQVQVCDTCVIVTYSLLSSEHNKAVIADLVPAKDGVTTTAITTTSSSSSQLLAQLERIGEKSEEANVNKLMTMAKRFGIPDMAIQSLLAARQEWHRRKLSGRAWSNRTAKMVALCYASLLVEVFALLIEPDILQKIAGRVKGRFAGLGRALSAPVIVLMVSVIEEAESGESSNDSSSSSAKGDSPTLPDLRQQHRLGIPIMDRSDNGSSSSRGSSRDWPRIIAGIFRVFALVAPYAIIGALSGFRGNQSTPAQRVWILLWLVFGQVIGAFTSLANSIDIFGIFQNRVLLLGATLILAITYGAPAIGGMVVVAQQLVSFGICSGSGS